MSRIYVAPISFGLGDLVVSLPAVQAVIARVSTTATETWLVARSDVQARLADRIAGLTGWVTEQSFDRDRHDGRFVDLRDHPLQRDWWWGSPEFEDAFGAARDQRHPRSDLRRPRDRRRLHTTGPLTASPRPEYRSSVLLVTESDGASKQWPVDAWKSLVDAVRALGLDVRMVTRDEAAPEMRGARRRGTCARRRPATHSTCSARRPQ